MKKRAVTGVFMPEKLKTILQANTTLKVNNGMTPEELAEKLKQVDDPNNYFFYTNLHPKSAVTQVEETLKFDTEKTPLHLVPYSSVEALGAVLAYGAKKYAPWNWRKGIAWSRYFSAAMRHLFQWWWVARKDPETGMSHLWHAMCNIAFLIEYEEHKLGEDDGPDWVER